MSGKDHHDAMVRLINCMREARRWGIKNHARVENFAVGQLGFLPYNLRVRLEGALEDAEVESVDARECARESRDVHRDWDVRRDIDLYWQRDGSLGRCSSEQQSEASSPQSDESAQGMPREEGGHVWDFARRWPWHGRCI